MHVEEEFGSHYFVIVSLLINILVLIPVCWGLIRDTKSTAFVYGKNTPARGILLAMYARC